MEEDWVAIWLSEALEEASHWDDVTEEVVFAIGIGKWDEVIDGFAIELGRASERTTPLTTGAIWATTEVDLGLEAKILSGGVSSSVVDDGTRLVVIKGRGSINKSLSDFGSASGQFATEVTAVGHAFDVDDARKDIRGLKGFDE